jgi:hypothetical protein
MALGANVAADRRQRVGLKIKRPATLATCLSGYPSLSAWGGVVCIGDLLPSCAIIGGGGLRAHPPVAACMYYSLQWHMPLTFHRHVRCRHPCCDCMGAGQDQLDLEAPRLHCQFRSLPPGPLLPVDCTAGTCAVGVQAVMTTRNDALPCVRTGAALGDGR